MFKFVVLSALVACTFGAAIPDGLLPQLDGRIVGGVETSISKFPWQVSLQRNGYHSCGGSIYSKYVIVTAAHCLQDINASALKVRAGSTSRSSGGSLVGVASFNNHPDYNARTMVYDIAVVRLSSALSEGTNIQPISLAISAPVAGTAAVVSGWGSTNFGSASVDILRYVDVRVISNADCASSNYNYLYEIRSTMICAAASGKDACQGDSGGPLVADGVLVGVVSWGHGCASTYYPGVYSDVAALRSWVVSNA